MASRRVIPLVWRYHRARRGRDVHEGRVPQVVSHGVPGSLRVWPCSPAHGQGQCKQRVPGACSRVLLHRVASQPRGPGHREDGLAGQNNAAQVASTASAKSCSAPAGPGGHLGQHGVHHGQPGDAGPPAGPWPGAVPPAGHRRGRRNGRSSAPAPPRRNSPRCRGTAAASGAASTWSARPVRRRRAGRRRARRARWPSRRTGRPGPTPRPGGRAWRRPARRRPAGPARPGVSSRPVGLPGQSRGQTGAIPRAGHPLPRTAGARAGVAGSPPGPR